MFGEAFDGNDELLGSYTHGEGVDSVFYFSAYYRVFMNVFAQAAPTEGIKALFEERKAKLTEPALVAETVDRICKLSCAKPDANDSRCLNGYDACVTQLNTEGIQRYSTTPKHLGPTSAEGMPLSSDKLLINFLDNHDVPRFLYSATPALSADEAESQRQQKKLLGHQRLRNALAYLLTFDGIPCIYYGTEQNFSGGPDPSNREDMWYSGFDQKGETYLYMKKLIKLRKELVALRRGDLNFVWTSNEPARKQGEASSSSSPGAGLLAFERSTPEQTVLVVVNTNDVDLQANEQAPRLDETKGSDGKGMKVSFPPNSKLRDALASSNDHEFTVNAEGEVVISLPPRSARVLVLAN